MDLVGLDRTLQGDLFDRLVETFLSRLERPLAGLLGEVFAEVLDLVLDRVLDAALEQLLDEPLDDLLDRETRRHADRAGSGASGTEGEEGRDRQADELNNEKTQLNIELDLGCLNVAATHFDHLTDGVGQELRGFESGIFVAGANGSPRLFNGGA
uniref:hypothetical protein n=1 Tax=Catelliglobosispora koreensis TaxID=129052 RepID=UPI0003602192|nr:hypothetical protein [Catelliglobosispora koreensis]